MTTRAQQICEFLFRKPNSTIKEIEEEIAISHHLMGVHLYRLKKEGLIINELRGRYSVTEKGQQLAQKTQAQPTQTSLIVEPLKGNSIGKNKPDTAKPKKQSTYRVLVQGESFAHDAVVDEEVARHVVQLLINKK